MCFLREYLSGEKCGQEDLNRPVAADKENPEP